MRRNPPRERIVTLRVRSQPERPVNIAQDSCNWLSAIRNLTPADVLVLLTPVVIPVSDDPGDTTDPFECFGKAIEKHHHKVRHVPYTMASGITSTHVGIIRSASVVVFVISEPRSATVDAPQIHAALVTHKALRNKRPLLIVLTSMAQTLETFYEDFTAVIQSRDYTQQTLEVTASFIFGKDGGDLTVSRRLGTPKHWRVERWDESRDIDGVNDLWTQSIDVRFAIHTTKLAALLRRPGYARHYVVRNSSGQHLGFCATFFSFVEQKSEKLIGSLAILLVDLEHRYQGVGLSLHNHAVDQLKKIRGVSQLQLGSTFPRILYGPPFCMEFDQAWFSRRGWRFDGKYPVYDLLLNFDTWPCLPPKDTTILRNGKQSDMERILEIVEAEGTRVGWFDQYARLIGDFNVKDVVVAVEAGVIACMALTYTPSCCSPISLDLPWAGQIGDDVGGVTCICIPRAYSARRDVLMVPLLNACIRKLQDQGMKGLFLDAVTSNVGMFKYLGLKEWASYRDVWRDI